MDETVLVVFSNGEAYLETTNLGKGYALCAADAGHCNVFVIEGKVEKRYRNGDWVEVEKR